MFHDWWVIIVGIVALTAKGYLIFKYMKNTGGRRNSTPTPVVLADKERTC
jgi:hypothetical protein